VLSRFIVALADFFDFSKFRRVSAFLHMISSSIDSRTMLIPAHPKLHASKANREIVDAAAGLPDLAKSSMHRFVMRQSQR